MAAPWACGASHVERSPEWRCDTGAPNFGTRGRWHCGLCLVWKVITTHSFSAHVFTSGSSPHVHNGYSCGEPTTRTCRAHVATRAQSPSRPRTLSMAFSKVGPAMSKTLVATTFVYLLAVRTVEWMEE